MMGSGMEGFENAPKIPTCDSLNAKLKMCSGTDVWLEKEESMFGDKKCMGKCGPKMTEGFVYDKYLGKNGQNKKQTNR
jgi:hypothetical protein